MTWGKLMTVKEDSVNTVNMHYFNHLHGHTLYMNLGLEITELENKNRTISTCFDDKSMGLHV